MEQTEQLGQTEQLRQIGQTEQQGQTEQLEQRKERNRGIPLSGIPAQDGFWMPGEFEPHAGCLMIWPERPGSWPYGAKAARFAFAQVAAAIAQSESVTMLVTEKNRESAEAMLEQSVELLEIETDDAWARDVGPTFVVNARGEVRGIDWEFNAWGGAVDGLYADWSKDQEAASCFCRSKGYAYYSARPFVLEGGSIHSDGEGTLLVTAACLLSAGRNPSLTKKQIEERLCQYLGAEKVIWLTHGIDQDETNEHVDNVCAFVRPGEVVLAWSEDPEDPQTAYSRLCLEELECAVDARGRRLRIHKLPIPKKPVCITQEELDGFVFEEGEDRREPGERLAASYVNFYIANKGVIVPQFGDEQDAEAVRILQECFPEREICPIDARDIIVGGGNIHCITQQIPLGREDREQ